MPQAARSDLQAMKKDLPAVRWLKMVRFDLEQALNCTIIPLPPGRNSFFHYELFQKTEEQAEESGEVGPQSGNREPLDCLVRDNRQGEQPSR